MKYAVVIPSLFEVDGEYLKLCVESLRASGFGGQIIVVTNGTKASPNLSHIKGITIHLHTSEQGQCRAVNIGAAAATPDTDYIMVSNSDMYYPPGWNKNLRFNYPVFSPNLIEPVDNAGSAPPFLKCDAGLTIEEFVPEHVNHLVKGLADINVDRYEYTKENNDGSVKLHSVVWASKDTKIEPGFNLPFFIKRDLWDLLGGYDIAFDPWGASSDTDLQMKIELSGVIPMRLRDVLVYHFSNKTPTFAPENQAFWQHNWDYLQDKWGFNRDEAGSDTWYHKDMIMWDKLKYHPDWEGKYAEEK